jgi:lipoprotein-anchoring transpeptidase ErfK/SrfK
MSRLAYATLLTTCLTAGAAFAAPLNLDPYPDYAAARRSAPPPSGLGAVFAAPPPPAAPERQVVAQGPSLGGGFIEMLFRGPAGQHPPGGYQQAPAVAPQPAPLLQQPRSRMFMQPEDVHHAALEPSRRDVHPRYQRQEVNYDGKERPGTVIINTRERLLYLVKENGRATRYGIGVGRPGFTWAGTHTISNMREWPDWRPPPEMLRRQPDLPRHMPGGPENPLGARAMYLGSTLYRIHGSNEPWTIGQAVSSGCIRMRNEDVIHLYNQVKVGTRVVVI